MDIERAMEEKGIRLPEPAKPVASYVPALSWGNKVACSGQLPVVEGKVVITGKLGKEVTLDEGIEAAKLCTLNALAAIRQEIGNLNQIDRVVRVSGYVASAEDFFDQSKVLNGASDLLIEVFGEKGKHVRSAVGVNTLPLNAAVELMIEATLKTDTW